MTAPGELNLIVRHYLRCSARAGQDNVLIAAGLPLADTYLLADATYWWGSAHLKPAISAEVFVDWDALWNQFVDDPPLNQGPQSPLEEFTANICEYYRTCARNPRRLEELAASGIDAATIEHLLLLDPLPPISSETPIAFARLNINHTQITRIQKYLLNHERELKQHLRLVKFGATYEMMKELTGISTHEFAAMRKVCAMGGPRGRLPQLTAQKANRIRELISLVCPHGKPPGVVEYLSLCDYIDTQELALGEIHAAHSQKLTFDKSHADGI